ncbi:MAG: hypothetical protein IIB07_10195 [Bacteroidetes bacterium]|nr:hypothetical protein [Bacteroidota bacterium]
MMQTMKEVCPSCLGTGVLTKQSHLIYDLEEWIKRFKRESKERSLIIRCNPFVAAKLREGRIKTLTKLKFRYRLKLKLEEDPSLSLQQIKFFSKASGKDLTEDYI